MEAILLIVAMFFSSPSEADLKVNEDNKVKPPIKVYNSNLDEVLGFIR